MSSTLPTPQLSPLARNLFPGAQEKIDRHICPHCGAKIDVTQFTDGRSLHEYTISGLCQSCQDAALGDGSK